MNQPNHPETRSTPAAGFETLSPERIIRSVEAATGHQLTGLLSPLPSYINRVYELQKTDGTRLIAKFYRPGRWSKAAIEEEHRFVADCAADDIPVVVPLTLRNGATVNQADNTYFAVFPKKGGREFEFDADDDWRRIGRVISRIHVAGSRRGAVSREVLLPQTATAKNIAYLVNGGYVTPNFRALFQDVGARLIDTTAPLFADIAAIRVHGDCHRGNFLYRPDEGLMIIDFDDMAMGPPMQDLWLLLPDHAARCRREIELLLEGYALFRDFDRRNLALIEPLRAMRMIYYLAWCAHQANDYRFQNQHPDWGTDGFWKKEISDITRQLRLILDNSESF